ncbi:MAG: hypothetical protein ACXVYV_05540 [Gaiellales bacterium]
MLLGVLAAGSHVSEVLRSIESPAAAFARAHKPRTNRAITQSHTAIRTQTRTVTQPDSTVTVTQPAQTVIVTETTPPTTTTPTSTSPVGAG